MTCDEFRKHNEKGVAGILALTRAERSACAQHWTQCFECRDWTMTFSFLMTPEQQAEIEATKYRDCQDPETFRINQASLTRFNLDKKSKDSKDAASARDYKPPLED